MLRSVKNLHEQYINVSGKQLGKINSFFVRKDNRRISHVVIAPSSRGNGTIQGRIVPVDTGFIIEGGPTGGDVRLASVKVPVSDPANFFPNRCVSTQELLGMSVITPKGMIGEIEDLVVEDENLEVRFLIVDSEQIFSEKNLLVRAGSIERIDIANHAVILSETIDEIR